MFGHNNQCFVGETGTKLSDCLLIAAHFWLLRFGGCVWYTRGATAPYVCASRGRGKLRNNPLPPLLNPHRYKLTFPMIAAHPIAKHLPLVTAVHLQYCLLNYISQI